MSSISERNNLFRTDSDSSMLHSSEDESDTRNQNQFNVHQIDKDNFTSRRSAEENILELQVVMPFKWEML